MRHYTEIGFPRRYDPKDFIAHVEYTPVYCCGKKREYCPRVKKKYWPFITELEAKKIAKLDCQDEDPHLWPTHFSFSWEEV